MFRAFLCAGRGSGTDVKLETASDRTVPHRNYGCLLLEAGNPVLETGTVRSDAELETATECPMPQRNYGRLSLAAGIPLRGKGIGHSVAELE